MKVIPLTIALFFLSSLLFAQHEAKPIKIGEYERNGGGGCDEYFRFSSLLEEMARYPESRGLVIVYAGKGDGRFGNLTAYVRGAQNYLSDVFKLEPNRRSLTQEKQLPRNRYKVRVIEATPHNDPNVPDLAVDLYLLPVSSFGRGISNLHRTSSTDEP